MAQLTVSAIALIIVFLLLIQPISLRLVLHNGYHFIIDYSLFSLIAEPSNDNKRKRKSRRVSIKGIAKFAKAILKSSKITVRQLRLPNGDSDPFGAAIIRGGLTFGVYSILKLIISHGRSADLVLDTPESEPGNQDDTPSFDVILETELYNILFAGIILLYEELKRRIRSLNVGKSNKRYN